MAREHHAQVRFVAWRFYLVILSILLVILGLAARVIDLTILKQHFLQHEGNIRVLRTLNTPAFRGMIMDRNGFPLAVSTSVYSAWLNPQEIVIDTNKLNSLSQLLGMKPSDIRALIKRHQRREFLYLRRGLNPEVAAEIKALKLPGLDLQEEYRRYYPEGEVTAHVVGLTNIDDKGQEGLELTCH